MICECYRAEKNFLGKVGLCWGTQERDACSCGGDKSKCDFYPSVRQEGRVIVLDKNHAFAMKLDDEEAQLQVIKDMRKYGLAIMKPKAITNADRLRAMSDEELAMWIRDQIIDRNIGIPSETWLDWLRQEAIE